MDNMANYGPLPNQTLLFFCFSMQVLLRARFVILVTILEAFNDRLDNTLFNFVYSLNSLFKIVQKSLHLSLQLTNLTISWKRKTN